MSVLSDVSFVIERIAEAVIAETRFLASVKDQVEGLQMELRWMKSCLKDLDGREEEEEGDERLRTSLIEIRMIAYDTEDFIDSFILKSASRKQGTLLKRCGCIFSCLVHTHNAGLEIDAIITRIKGTSQMMQRYQVELNRGNDGANRAYGERPRGPIRRQRRSYPHGGDDYVVGLEEDIVNLVRELIGKGSNKRFLCIIGMGGSGKTTLARKLYNHNSIKQHFNCQAWVSISQEWVSQHILLEILRKASGQTPTVHEAWSHEEVVEKIQAFLENKLYLVVLDDVWKKKALEDILPALPSGAKGSTVIITTRKQKVLQFPDLSYSIHEPQRLNEKEGWLLFSKIVLNHRDEASQFVLTGEFETLGREMLKRCEGLPLAIIALGGLLGSKEAIEEWENLYMVMSSKIMAEGRGTHQYGAVKDMLALSYHDLPYELKPCFLYLSLFPEDSEIPTGMLIRMWIAEGFITVAQQITQGERTLEDVGRGYVDELVQRCVVHVSRRNYAGEVKRILVHDLIRDLCIKKAREQEFLQNVSSRSSRPLDEATKSRRIVIHSYSASSKYFPLPDENAHLRSLFLFARTNVGIHKYSTDQGRAQISLEPIHKNFSLLRVLKLVGVDTCDGTVPKEIGRLIHLRYLGIRVSNIRELPDSIGNLRNLLTLDYRGFEGLEGEIKIPNVLWKMEKLRHLCLPNHKTSSMEKLKLHSLKNLQIIWGIRADNWMLKELPQLSSHLYKLYIHGISRREQLQAVFQCPSILEDRLVALQLDWLGLEPEPYDLEQICHCRHLYKLTLTGSIVKHFGPFRLPPNLTQVQLFFTGIEGQETIASWQLQKLKIVRLSRGSYLGTQWTCRQGDFPRLEELSIAELPNLEEWTLEKGAMPYLRKLTLRRCGKLRLLPEGLKFINTLQELVLCGMAPALYRVLKHEDGASEEVGEYIHTIQHIPTIRVLD